MDIEYHGANCVIIKNKTTSIVVDPTTNSSAKEQNSDGRVVLSTMGELAQRGDELVIDMPGEFEYREASIKGIPVHRHTDESGKNATMYQVDFNDVKIAIIGHTDAPLEDDDLENLGMIDIVIIPIGGNGYTLDGHDAATIVRQISPKIVIPTHFDDGKTTYEVPQEIVEPFAKELGVQHEKQSSLKIKTSGDLSDTLTIVELSRLN